MHQPDGERGITFIGLLSVLVIVAFVAIIAMKLVPVYLESFKIEKAMASVVSDPSIAEKSSHQISRMLTKRLDIDSVERITERNVKDYVTVKNQQGKVTIDTVYRAEVPLFANIGVVVDFDKHAEN